MFTISPRPHETSIIFLQSWEMMSPQTEKIFIISCRRKLGDVGEVRDFDTNGDKAHDLVAIEVIQTECSKKIIF